MDRNRFVGTPVQCHGHVPLPSQIHNSLHSYTLLLVASLLIYSSTKEPHVHSHPFAIKIHSHGVTPKEMLLFHRAV
jgi:hypothetical protein